MRDLSDFLVCPYTVLRCAWPAWGIRPGNCIRNVYSDVPSGSTGAVLRCRSQPRRPQLPRWLATVLWLKGRIAHCRSYYHPTQSARCCAAACIACFVGLLHLASALHLAQSAHCFATARIACFASLLRLASSATGGASATEPLAAAGLRNLLLPANWSVLSFYHILLGGQEYPHSKHSIVRKHDYLCHR